MLFLAVQVLEWLDNVGLTGFTVGEMTWALCGIANDPFFGVGTILSFLARACDLPIPFQSYFYVKHAEIAKLQ